MTREEREALCMEMIAANPIEAMRTIEQLFGKVETLGAENVELKAESERLKSTISAMESDLFHEKMNGEMMAKRAEALERGIKQYSTIEQELPDSEDYAICYCCVHVDFDMPEREDYCTECIDCDMKHFDFDEAKFTKGAGE